jgi:hypothetical protein
MYYRWDCIEFNKYEGCKDQYGGGKVLWGWMFIHGIKKRDMGR